MPLGWEEHLDKRGTPCAYCGASSTRTLIVEPDVFVNGECKRRGKRVGICDDHEPEMADDVAAAVSFHRRKSKGAEQLAMDTGDARADRKRDAIFGNDK
jgi:hypothetical protein